MQTIKDQIIAATGTDKNGITLSEAQLYEMFEEMTDPQILNNDHDLSRPPVGRMYNQRIARLEDERVAIVADVELNDDVEYIEGMGYSMSFRHKTYSTIVGERGDMAVGFNPRYFDPKSFRELISYSTDNFSIDVIEYHQRSLEPDAVVILMFAGEAAAGYFIGRGAEIALRSLCKKLKELADQRHAKQSQETVFQLRIDYQVRGTTLPVILSVKRENLDAIQSDEVSASDVVEYVREVVGDSDVQRVAIRFEGNPPTFHLDYFVDRGGRVVTL